MPLNKSNCRSFHRVLFAGTGTLQKITLLKRDDDQRQGTVTPLILYEARHSQIHKTGEPIAGDMAVGHRVTWHLPRIELDRVGVDHINAADRIVEEDGTTWMPESYTAITVKLFGVHIDIDCTRMV